MPILSSQTTAQLKREDHQVTAQSALNGRLLTPSDVASYLQVEERTITKWLRESTLRGYKIGKEWRVSKIDLDAFLEAGANR